VKTKFVTQLLFDTPALEERAESQPEFVKPAHLLSLQLSAVSRQLSAVSNHPSGFSKDLRREKTCQPPALKQIAHRRRADG
jgi:hypothetical protein